MHNSDNELFKLQEQLKSIKKAKSNRHKSKQAEWVFDHQIKKLEKKIIKNIEAGKGGRGPSSEKKMPKFKLKGKKESYLEEGKLKESGHEPVMADIDIKLTPKKKKKGKIIKIKSKGSRVEDNPTDDESVEYKKLRREKEGRISGNKRERLLDSERVKYEKDIGKRIKKIKPKKD